MGEMREILFRGQVKDKDELIGKGFTIGGTVNPISEWVYGVPIPRYPDLFLAWSEGNGEYEEITVIPETVGQYTCLTDKNGTRVFENDIVTVYYNPKYVGVSKDRVGNFAVVFHDGCFMKRKITNPMSGDAGLYHFIQSDEFEVIGNIYDNPELIESQL